MNLRGLKYFVAVAQAKSFTEAASRLHVAQPAISRQIQNLEQELGVELFRRTRNGIFLTGAGDFLIQRTLPLLLELNNVKELLSKQSEAQVEDVVIGLTTGEGLAFAPMLLKQWGEMFPAAKLRIVEGLAPLIYSGLGNNTIDIGVAPEPLEFERVWTKPLFEEPLVLISPHENTTSLSANIDTSNITELLKLPLIAPSYPNPLRGNIEVLAKKYNVTLNICVELDSMSIIKDLVRRGSGYALTTYAHLANEMEHNILKIMPIESPDFWRNVCLFGLLSDDGAQPSSIAINFIEKLILDTVEADLWPGARPLQKNKK